MPKPQIHQSHISMLSRCGEQYRRRYICGERRPPGVAAHVGSGIHVAHDMDMAKLLETKAVADLDATTDAAVAAMRNRWQEEGVHLWGEDAKVGEKTLQAQAIDRLTQMNSVRHRELAPTLKPVHVARKWVAELEGYPYDLAGEMDLEAEDGLHDLKAKTGWPKSGLADSSDQLTVYSLARHFCYQVPLPQDVHLDFVCGVQGKTKLSVGVKKQSSVRTTDHIDGMLAKLERVMQVLEKGVFMPANPDDWICSPKFCGYYGTCPFVKGRVVVGYGD